MDIILLCYDVQSYATFARLHCRWLPKIAQHIAHAPVILVGLKEDMRGHLQRSVAEVDADVGYYHLSVRLASEMPQVATPVLLQHAIYATSTVPAPAPPAPAAAAAPAAARTAAEKRSESYVSSLLPAAKKSKSRSSK